MIFSPVSLEGVGKETATQHFRGVTIATGKMLEDDLSEVDQTLSASISR